MDPHHPATPDLHSTEQLLHTTRDPLQSHAQTSRDQASRRVKPGQTSIEAYLDTMGTRLNWIWHYLRSRFGPRYSPRAYPVHGNTGVYQMADTGTPLRFGIAADWGSYSAESDGVMQQLALADPHYTIHLGDVYFTGTPDEIRDNFTGSAPCWHYGREGTYVIPGNHEMYSNGRGFFVTLLGILRQRHATGTQASSYWCLESEHWRIIGLDTGRHSISIPVIEALWPPPTYIDPQAIRWLREVVFRDPADRRGLIILTHHQITSAFDDSYPRAAQQLAKVLGPATRDVVWLWGHEHRLAQYGLQPAAGGAVPAWGRCIGHGGMPVELSTADPARAQQTQLEYYDNRLYKTVSRGREIGYNGFVNMVMDGPKISLNYVDITGAILRQESFTVHADRDGAISRES